jgi:hypothetical protein
MILSVENSSSSSMFSIYPKSFSIEKLFSREMENISRGPIILYLWGFCTYPHREVNAEQHGCKDTEYKSANPPLPPLLNVMYCVRVSLKKVKIFLAQY